LPKIESGAKTERKALARAIAELGPGSCLIVTKLDRLARSLKDLLVTLDAVAKAGAGFKVLDTPALDTTSAYGQLLLNVLGALAQFERSLIISRTSEGRQRAMAKGIKFGRKHVLNPYQRQEALGPVDIHRSQIMAPMRNSMDANESAVFS
jgi:DNA invertase Pin-like site-specific DNA recombinase